MRAWLLGVAGLLAAAPPHAAASCAAGELCVAPGQRLGQAIALAPPNTTISLAPGAWREAVVIDRPGLTLIGAGAERTRIDCTGQPLARGKACIVVAAPGVVIERLSIEGAVLPQSDNGACIRNEANIALTLRFIRCAHSQEGLLSAGGRILIEDSTFLDNGWNGFTHNIYLSGACEAVVRRTEIRGARVGHELKSRCARLLVEESTLVVVHGSRALDVPDGGMVTVRGGRIVQGADTDNADIVGFTPEHCLHPGDLSLIGVTIETARVDAQIRNYDRCPDAVIRLAGVHVVGLPIALVGRVEQVGPAPR
jgi:hypothetical protein